MSDWPDVVKVDLGILGAEPPEAYDQAQAELDAWVAKVVERGEVRPVALSAALFITGLAGLGMLGACVHAVLRQFVITWSQTPRDPVMFTAVVHRKPKEPPCLH